METLNILSKIKKPFVIVGSVLMVYVVTSVYVVPALLKWKIPEIIQQETGRKALISEIQVQPFPLAIRLQGVEVQEHNGQPFAAFDDFYIKLGLLRSIKQLALVFDEVLLSKSYVHIARQKNGTFNFQDLLKDKKDDNKQQGQPFPVNIVKLTLTEGNLVWEDARFDTPVIEDINPINLDIENLTTRTDKPARLGVSLTLKSGGFLDWKGTANLKTGSSEGHIKFDQVTLETIMALALPDNRLFNLKGYELLDADYNASYTKNGVQFTVNKGSFEIHDFEFLEKNQNKTLIKMPVFSVQGIDFDFEKRALLIASVSANDADFQVDLNAQGVINYSALFPTAKTATNNPPNAPANPVEPNEAPWTIKVNALALSNFGVVFEDQTLKKPVVTNFKPINVKLTDYSSDSGAVVPYELSAGINKTGLIKLVGDAVMQPFSANSVIDVSGIALENFEPYINQFARLDIINGKLVVDGNVVVAIPDKNQLDVKFKGNSAITGLLIRDQQPKDKAPKKDLAKVPVFVVRGIDFNLANQELVLNSISANNAEFQGWLNPDGVINYLALLPTAQTDKITIDKTTANTVKPQTATWKIKVNDMALTNLGLNFEDQTLKNPLTINLKPITFKLKNYSNKNGAKLPVELTVGINKAGVMALKGDAVLAPFSARLNLDAKAIDLESFQPYFDKLVRLDVVDGDFHIDGKVSVATSEQNKLDVKFKGNTGVSRLLTRDQTLLTDLVKWEDLDLKDLDIDVLANRYTAAALVIDKPYARVTIKKDKTVNFSDMVISDISKPQPLAKTTPNKQTDSNKPYFKLGKIQVTDGSSDFSDLSLIMPFAAQIKNLDGGASGISSAKNSIITVVLKGNAYDLAPVNIKGEMSPYFGSSQVDMNFNGLPMPLVSPYMVEFAGYKVEKGKMTLSLKYTIVNSQLTATNNILIDQFELGDKVDNPKAVSLPIKLAVALLKDSNGRIKIEVPITGSLDDPQFSVGAIVTDALMNALKKVVTSPFLALGSLLGSEKDMSLISFPAGYSALSTQQQEKLDALSKALKERPILKLDIKGASFQEQDWPIIREDALYEQLKIRRAAEINKDAVKKIRAQYVLLSDSEYKRLLAEMFMEKFPLLSEKSFLGTPKLMNPAAGDFYEVAKQKLFTIIKPEQDRLKVLASARAQIIANYVVQKGGVPSERVYILDAVVDPERNNKEIVSALSLNAGD
ncbi:MAG: DUF748 domain-containing protein [Methylococcaceae bacterium]